MNYLKKSKRIRTFSRGLWCEFHYPHWRKCVFWCKHLRIRQMRCRPWLQKSFAATRLQADRCSFRERRQFASLRIEHPSKNQRDVYYFPAIPFEVWSFSIFKARSRLHRLHPAACWQVAWHWAVKLKQGWQHKPFAVQHANRNKWTPGVLGGRGVNNQETCQIWGSSHTLPSLHLSPLEEDSRSHLLTLQSLMMKEAKELEKVVMLVGQGGANHR